MSPATAHGDFFETVLALHRQSAGAVAVGGLGPVEREPVRFRQDPSLVFHTGDVVSLKTDPRSHTTTMVLGFMGLTGAVSPLANYFSEEVLRADDEDAPALRDFLDIFHHRLYSLLYRSWLKYRPTAEYRDGSLDPLTIRYLSFVGIDGTVSNEWCALPPLTQLSLATLLSQRPRSARTLCAVLGRLFPGIEVKVESFVPRRATIPEPQRLALGVRCSTLGEDLTIGESVADCGGRFRVLVAPLVRERFDDYAPGGRHFPLLRRAIEQFSRGFLEAELELQLLPGERPSWQLGKPVGGTLGVDTRLGGRAARIERMRVVLSERAEEVKVRWIEEDAHQQMSEPP
jgi:type VI secretion system protein ImpH